MNEQPSLTILREYLWYLRLLDAKSKRSNDGLRKHPLYTIWAGMFNRCYNPDSTAFSNYGARNISICDRWLSLRNFIDDMGNRGDTSNSIDRIDPNKGYSPENCRWATKHLQRINRRIDKEIETKAIHSKIMQRCFA
jgi:hypothetical protein